MLLQPVSLAEIMLFNNLELLKKMDDGKKLLMDFYIR